MFFLIKRDKFTVQGKILAMYRTKIGLNLMDRIANAYPRLVKAIGYVGVVFGFSGMVFMFFFLIRETFKFVTMPGTPPPLAPVLPGVSIPGVPTLSFWHCIIAIFLVALVHEFSHGVLARVHKIKIQSSGFAFMGPILAAFVEPDEKEMASKKTMQQLSVLAAGPFSNMVLGLIFLLILNFFTGPLTGSMFQPGGITVSSYMEGYPAEATGLKTPLTILKINGEDTMDFVQFVNVSSRIKPGDEVITSPFSFVASANSILYVGAKPVFVDIDPVTYNMDPLLIEKKINKKTKAILIVHILGQAADMDPILKIARRYKLKIIEDACESLGAIYKGKKVGTFGESAVFAFYPNKQMTTGEEGMIVTNDEKIDKLCRSLRNQGRAENMQWLDHERLGYNYRMDELSAAVGLAQIERINFLISERGKIAGWYGKSLSRYPELVRVPAVAENNTHTWFVYVVILKNTKIVRDNLIDRLAIEGISTKPYMPSIHLFSFYKKLFGYKKGDFPVSESVSNRSIALPFYIGLKESDIGYICRKLIKELQ